jgi:hypothetical protein
MPCGTLDAATTPQSQPQLPSAAEAQLMLAGGRTTEGTATPIHKNRPPSGSDFFSFQNPGNGM